MLYNRDFNPKKILSLSFSSSSLFSLPHQPLSPLLFFSLLFLLLSFSFSLLSSSGQPLFRPARPPASPAPGRLAQRRSSCSPAAQQPARTSRAPRQAGEADPGRGNPAQIRPAQARSDPVRVRQPRPSRRQLVRELSFPRRPRSVNDFLVFTRRLVAAAVVITHEFLEIDFEVRNSRNGLSKISA